GDVLVITGRGNRSIAGVSVVRQAVLALLRTLRRRGVVSAMREHTAGSFVVTLEPLSSLRSAPSRRKDPTPAQTTDPRVLAGLSRETRKLLRSVALCSLESLGVREPEAFVEREMLAQLSHLGATIREGPMREERLRNAFSSFSTSSSTAEALRVGPTAAVGYFPPFPWQPDDPCPARVFLSDFLQFALITFTSVLFIVDPIAVIPTYLVITRNETPAQRRTTARRATIAAALLMIVFGIAGRLIFRLFGITLPAFRIAGGLILWYVAMDMLRGQRSTQESSTEIAEGAEKDDVALTPLAMPMLAGPGAISTVMVLANQARSVPEAVVVYGSVVLTAAMSWGALRLGERLVVFLGQTGIRVMTRIMGLLLAAVAVQFVVTGARDAFLAHG